jgi:hypothetical protein
VARDLLVVGGVGREALQIDFEFFELSHARVESK